MVKRSYAMAVLDDWSDEYVWDKTDPMDDEGDSDSEEEGIDYPDTPNSDQDSEDEDNVCRRRRRRFHSPVNHLAETDMELSDDEEMTAEHHAVLRMPLTNLCECQLCCHTGIGLCDANLNVLSISALVGYDVDIHLDNLDKLRDYVVLRAPCGVDSHVYCVKCLRTITTNPHLENTLRMGSGYCGCPSSTANCVCSDEEGRPYVYSTSALRYIFTPLEITYYNQMAARFRGSNHRVATDRFNHYMWSRGKEDSPYFPALLMQKEVTADAALKQIQFLLSADRLEVQCKECGVMLHKTSQCNALSHCGVEVCNVCGFSDVVLPPDHWKKCPRFDTDKFWHEQCGFQCVEGKCYSDIKECQVAEHQDSIKSVTETRRKFHVKALWESLPQLVSDSVMKMLPETDQTRLKTLCQ